MNNMPQVITKTIRAYFIYSVIMLVYGAIQDSFQLSFNYGVGIILILFFYAIINTLFLLLVYFIEINKNILTIKWVVCETIIWIFALETVYWVKDLIPYDIRYHEIRYEFGAVWGVVWYFNDWMLLLYSYIITSGILYAIFKCFSIYDSK